MIESPAVILRRHGLAARKPWGQHFLHEMEVHRTIALASGARPGDRVVEIGAGLGTLTAHLLATGAEVWAIERDRDLCTVLRHEFLIGGSAEESQQPASRLRLFEADAVRFDYTSAVREDGSLPRIVGNLPYHLTAPLLYALLRVHAKTGPWVVMVQKEVADRMCAAVGDKAYGSMTIGLSRLRAIARVMHVPRGAFVPPPRVDSAVVRLDPRPEPRGHVTDDEAFLRLVRTAFQRRRKTLANALSALAPREHVLAWCAEAGVDPTLRPERIDVEQYAALERVRAQASGV